MKFSCLAERFYNEEIRNATWNDTLGIIRNESCYKNMQ